jgi:hypothetical protein
VGLHLAHHSLVPQLRVPAAHGIAVCLGLCIGQDSLGVNGRTERMSHGLGQLDVLVVVIVDGAQALRKKCADISRQLSDSVQCQSACQARLRLRVQVVVVVLVSGPVSSIPRVVSRLRARSSVLDKLRKAMGTVVVRGERVTPSQSHSHMYVLAQPRICTPYTLPP